MSYTPPKSHLDMPNPTDERGKGKMFTGTDLVKSCRKIGLLCLAKKKKKKKKKKTQNKQILD